MRKIIFTLLLLILIIGCTEKVQEPGSEEEINQIQDSTLDYEENEKLPLIIEEKTDDRINDIEAAEDEQASQSEKIVLTEHLFDLNKVDYIVPLGELEGGWHERETNNMNLVRIKQPGGHDSPAEIMKIYAPTKVSLTAYSYYSYEGSTPSWTLELRMNADKTLKLSALTEVADKIRNTVGTQTTQGEKKLATPLLFEPGELLGSSGGEISNWDVLFYDKKNTNQFVNQQRYEADYMGALSDSHLFL